MTIEEKGVQEKIIVDLDGPQGNAHYLLGLANQLGRLLGVVDGLNPDIIEEMKSGDYINLLRVFDDAFGDLVTLQTSNPEYLDAFMKEGI